MLENKVILVISPQSWGKMFLSKHHYAVELAKAGNTVYFLNPPDNALKERVLIEPVPATMGLYIISHRITFPYNIKFRVISVFHWLMQWQVKKITEAIGQPIDIVWSFDLGHLYPFHFFNKKAVKIFHPVDEPVNTTAIQSAKGAQVIFSVTREILQQYKMYRAPKHFINHGVTEVFLHQPAIKKKMTEPLSVGFSGNLLRQDIDRPVFLQIIREHPGIVFECWGSYQPGQTNIGGALDAATLSFIQSLQQLPNVRLHGVVSSEILAREYQRMDAFLICYDIEKDQSKGTNYHKVMEYLAAGKVIIANNITTYQDKPRLVSMVAQRDSNRMLPVLFKQIVNNLSDHNSETAIEERKSFARANTYDKQVQRIETILDTLYPDQRNKPEYSIL